MRESSRIVAETSEFGSEEKPSGTALKPFPPRHGKSEMNVSYGKNENYVMSANYGNCESCAKNAKHAGQLC